jgi:hypothetical protein
VSPASGTAAGGGAASSVLRGFGHLPLPPLQELQVRPAGQPKARRASAPYQSLPQQLPQLQPLQEQQQDSAEAAVDRPPSRDGQRQRYRRASAPYQSPTQQLHAAAAADASSGLSGMQE